MERKQMNVSFRRKDYKDYKELRQKGYFTLKFSEYCKAAFAGKFQKDKKELGILNENTQREEE